MISKFTKNTGFDPLFRRYIFEKSTIGNQVEPHPSLPAISGLNSDEDPRMQSIDSI